MFYRLFIILLLSSHWLVVAAQQSAEEKTLTGFLKEGEFEMHARSYFMSTVNKDALTDFGTLATGAGLGYLSPYYKNLRIGMSGFFIWQLYEHNLTNAMSSSRYETSLYDIHHAKNKTDLDRLEELYVQYKDKSIEVTLGRQKIHSPFLNEQDNRMRPNLFSGLKAKYAGQHLLLVGAWITGVSPRGTTRWYSVEESFGVYPSGRSMAGAPSAYYQHISSKGIGMLGAKYSRAFVRQQLWNYYADNVFNLSFAQTDFHIPAGKDTLLFGVQGLYQSPLNRGGNAEPDKAYMLPGQATFGGGLQAGLRKGSHQLTLNLLGISGQGRFLFPREWGREMFYASLPRERFEGSGDLRAYTLKYEYTTPAGNISTLTGIGKADFPAAHHFALNKYGMPSYYHFAGSIRYRARGMLKGMEIMMQTVYKLARDAEALTDQHLLNKADMTNLSLIVDYRF